MLHGECNGSACQEWALALSPACQERVRVNQPAAAIADRWLRKVRRPRAPGTAGPDPRTSLLAGAGAAARQLLLQARTDTSAMHVSFRIWYTPAWRYGSGHLKPARGRPGADPPGGGKGFPGVDKDRPEEAEETAAGGETTPEVVELAL